MREREEGGWVKDVKTLIEMGSNVAQHRGQSQFTVTYYILHKNWKRGAANITEGSKHNEKEMLSS